MNFKEMLKLIRAIKVMIKKLSEINLNLLNVLDILLTEKNTTSAGKKLHLTQPTVSYSLKQLREIFDDELLVKNNFSSSMYLTPLAKSLIKPVREAVQNLENIFKLKEFDPATSRRQFKIATTDYAIYSIISKLIKEVRNEAPLITFYIADIEYSRVKEQLEVEDIDIAIGGVDLEKEKGTIVYEFLMDIEPVCWADKNHPAFQSSTLSLEEYMKYPHMIVRYPKSGSTSSIENTIMKDYVDSGSITNLSIHNTTEGICLLEGTDYICLGGKDVGLRYADFSGLAYRKPPFEVQSFTILACRHINKDNDEAVLWLMSKIKEIASKI